MSNWFSTKIPKQFKIEREVFSTNGAGKSIYAQGGKKKSICPYFIHTQKLKLKRSKILMQKLKLNAKAKTIHLLREDIGENLHKLV